MMGRKAFLLAVGAALAWPALAAIQTEEITYSSADGTSMKGYLAWDDATAAKRPGVLVVHEWWGHNEYARKRARMLAGLGYTALAVDMYGDGKTASHPDDAGKFATAVRQHLDVGRARFQAAEDRLKQHPTVDASRIAAIGYCFGGAVVLQMARDGLDLAAVASFHGSLATTAPAKPGAVKARMLVCHGGADKFISDTDIADFKAEMKAAGAQMDFKVYPGALHSFTNPEADEYAKKFSMPIGYNAAADQQSWQDMQDLFKQVFAR